MDRRHHESRTELLERKKREIAKRLERVCAAWDPGAFARLVQRIAEIEIKYAMRLPREGDPPLGKP